jgi:methylglutamate dehydrogenase subunit D
LSIRKGNGFVHDLTPITALGGKTAQVHTIGGVTGTEVPDVALASYSSRLGKGEEAAAILKEHLGVSPPAAGKSANATLSAFWMGPEQWMVEAPFEEFENIAQTLALAARDVASVTEQTDAWTRFDLSGDGVLDVLELLVAIDTRRMEAGDATRGSIHHLGCFVTCAAPGHFQIYGPRASAASLHHAILTAMNSTA